MQGVSRVQAWDAGCKAWDAGCKAWDAGCKAWDAGEPGRDSSRRALRVAARPVHGRGGQIGVLRHRPRAHASRPRPPGDGRRPGPDEPLRAQMGLGTAEQGLLRLGPGGPVHRRARLARNPGRPGIVGESGLGVRLSRTPPAGRAPGLAGVANLPQDVGGALRPGRHLLGHPLPPTVRSARYPAADPVLADLERAQSEEVLRAIPIGSDVRPPAGNLPRRDPQR